MRKTVSAFSWLLAAPAVALLAISLGAQTRTPAATTQSWVTAWATSHQALGSDTITDATVRLLARVTLPGDALRIRLDNTFGTESLVIGRASIGARVQGALLASGSVVPLTFNGAPSVTIPPGGSAWSDRAALAVVAQQDVAVSLFVPGAQVKPSQHTGAVVTSYRTADGAGDATADESRALFTGTITSTWWLKAIDVETLPTARAIVAFGDSITDGTCTTRDAHDRWEDLLSVRLALAQDGPAATRPPLRSVLNEGIGGNTVTRNGLTPAPDSPPGLERFDRDVLSHHGVSHVIVFMGTNDIRRGATAGSVIAGLAEISKRVEAAGLRSIGVTIIPRHNVAPTDGNSGWNDQKTLIRREVNQWIRSRGSFDAVLDFDAIVRDLAQRDVIQGRYNCGDGIHPSPAGYFAMGRSIDLSLFTRR